MIQFRLNPGFLRANSSLYPTVVNKQALITSLDDDIMVYYT